MDKRRLSKGFTMTEVMIVVLIMSIVTLTGLPLLTTSMDHYRLKGAAEEVVNAFRYAQSSAMSSGRKTRVVIGHLSNRIGVRQYTLSADLFAGGNELVEGDVESGTYE
jgi:prepilin-type N-terminal cleavage/methylation domain-containing protein